MEKGMESWENFCGQKFSQTLSKNFNWKTGPPHLALPLCVLCGKTCSRSIFTSEWQ